jgi:hypothetical protein
MTSSNPRIQFTLVQICETKDIEEIYCVLYIKAQDKKRSKSYKTTPQNVCFINETFNLVPSNEKLVTIEVYDLNNTMLGKARYNYSDLNEFEQVDTAIEFEKGKIMVEVLSKDFGHKLRNVTFKYGKKEGEMRFRPEGFISAMQIKDSLRLPLVDLAFLKIISVYNQKHKILIDPEYHFYKADEFRDGQLYSVEIGQDDVPKLTTDEVDQIQRDYTAMNNNISTAKMKLIIENLRKKEKDNIMDIFNKKVISTSDVSSDMDEMMKLNAKLKACDKFLDEELNQQLKYLATLEVDKNSVISFEEYLKFIAKYKILERKK